MASSYQLVCGALCSVLLLSQCVLHSLWLFTLIPRVSLSEIFHLQINLQCFFELKHKTIFILVYVVNSVIVYIYIF